MARPEPVADALRARRSHSAVGVAAPGDKELRRLLEVAATVADHAALRPWRVIALRGEARERLGQAFVEASGLTGPAADKLAAKPLRAPLLLAIVASPVPNFKVHDWEQEAVASGIAHTLSLLLDEAGWGVMWRSGVHTRAEAVHRAHELAPHERLLGWLYVGSRPAHKSGTRAAFRVEDHLSRL